MFEILRMIVASIAVFGVLVFIHEMGHYLAARYCNVKIDVFSIGFGPALKSWFDKKGTEWRLSVFPLGGYVRLNGFEAPPAESEESAALLKGRTFYEKSPWAKMLVVAMGPIFNFLLAIFLYSVIFCAAGVMAVSPRVESVMAEGPAAGAGIMAGDLFIALEGKPIQKADPIREFISSHPDQTLHLEIQRGGEKKAVSVTPAHKGKEAPYIGVVFGVERTGALPVYKAVPMAVETTWDNSVTILKSLGQIITGKRSAAELGGPIRIVQISGQAASSGMIMLLSLTALLSVNLGLFNLLPIPALDGGRFLFYALEAIFRRPVPERVGEIFLQMGVMLILLLFLLSTYNDLKGIGVFGWFHRIFAFVAH